MTMGFVALIVVYSTNACIIGSTHTCMSAKRIPTVEFVLVFRFCDFRTVHLWLK